MFRKNYKSVIILAGGDSSRLKFPKLFLPFNSNYNFLEKIICEYVDFGCEEIIMVLNKKFYTPLYFDKIKNQFDVNLIINNHSNLGRFYSIKLGINALSEYNFCFIQNIDNPFVDFEILNQLDLSKNKGDYCVPYFNSLGGHPILINKNIIQRIKNETKLDANLKDILKEFKKVEIPVHKDNILVNINTLDDYKMYINSYLNINTIMS